MPCSISTCLATIGVAFLSAVTSVAALFYFGGNKVAKNYMINTDTGKLHIVGCCNHTTGTRPNHIVFFDTEEEVYLNFGRQVRTCSLCQKKKEQKMEETK